MNHPTDLDNTDIRDRHLAVSSTVHYNVKYIACESFIILDQTFMIVCVSVDINIKHNIDMCFNNNQSIIDA